MAVAAFTFSSGAFAQIQRKTDSTQQTMHQNKQHHQMMTQLDLTKEQKEKMKEMRQENKSKMDEIKNDNSLTQEQRKAKMMELRKAQKGKMKAILTKDQQEKMKAYKKNHHRKHGKMNGKKMEGKKRGQKNQAPVQL